MGYAVVWMISASLENNFAVSFLGNLCPPAAVHRKPGVPETRPKKSQPSLFSPRLASDSILQGLS